VTKRAARDIIAVSATALVLALFYWYMEAASQRAVEEAERSKRALVPPVLTLRTQGPYEAGKEVWVEVDLASRTNVELRAPELVWPGTVDFELLDAPRKAPPATIPPATVVIPPRGRVRRRIDLSCIFELAPGEHQVRARYESVPGKGLWAGTIVSAVVKLEVAPTAGLPAIFKEIRE